MRSPTKRPVDEADIDAVSNTLDGDNGRSTGTCDVSGSTASDSSVEEGESSLPPPTRKALRFEPSKVAAPTKVSLGKSDAIVRQRKAAGRVKLWRGQKDLFEMLASVGEAFSEEFPTLVTPEVTRRHPEEAWCPRPG